MMIPKQKRTFFDDYEDDSIELWDAIEEINNRIDTMQKMIDVLQKEIETNRIVLNAVLKVNGLKMRKVTQ